MTCVASVPFTSVHRQACLHVCTGARFVLPDVSLIGVELLSVMCPLWTEAYLNLQKWFTGTMKISRLLFAKMQWEMGREFLECFGHFPLVYTALGDRCLLLPCYFLATPLALNWVPRTSKNVSGDIQDIWRIVPRISLVTEPYSVSKVWGYHFIWQQNRFGCHPSIPKTRWYVDVILQLMLSFSSQHLELTVWQNNAQQSFLLVMTLK